MRNGVYFGGKSEKGTIDQTKEPCGETLIRADYLGNIAHRTPRIFNSLIDLCKNDGQGRNPIVVFDQIKFGEITCDH